MIEYAEDEDDEDETEGAEESPKPAKPKQLFVIINPEIVKASEEKVNGHRRLSFHPRLAG